MLVIIKFLRSVFHLLLAHQLAPYIIAANTEYFLCNHLRAPFKFSAVMDMRDIYLEIMKTQETSSLVLGNQGVATQKRVELCQLCCIDSVSWNGNGTKSERSVYGSRSSLRLLCWGVISLRWFFLCCSSGQGRDRITWTRASSFASRLSLALSTDYALSLLAGFLLWFTLLEFLSGYAAN